MMKLEDLKRMLPDQEGVVFVGNENTFQEAVEREGYGEYFTDRFAGYFGHCTHKGYRLLAENIARAIVKGASGVKGEAQK